MKKILVCCFSLSCLASFATIDQPDVRTFKGTGYYADGWFDYQTSVSSEKDGLIFGDKTKFVTSPRYARPIRKVVLSVSATQTDPKRYLRLWPYVNGVEVTTNAFDCSVRHVAAPSTFEFVTFDFDEARSVDAFRLSLDGTGSSGSWRVAMICVVYGEKTADEDDHLKTFACELPTPADIRLTALAADGLSLAADSVDGAVGYRFRIARLVGTPRTELREDFDFLADDLTMADGWSLTCENAKVFACTKDSNSTYVDKSGSDVYGALKIEMPNKPAGDVRVEIISPTAPEAVTGYSFVSKRAQNESSNRVTVYGRAVGSNDWQSLDEPFAMSTSMVTTRNDVDVALNIEQVKFVFTAETNATFRPCALDTLRVIYGGNESREFVDAGTAVRSDPTYSTNGLETARYECQVQAVGGELRDSSWSSPLVVDLNWTGLAVTAPTGIVTSASGGMLTVSWAPVDGADHYLVDIVSLDDPDVVVVRGRKVTGTTFTTAVPSVGEYGATVTAVAPGGLACAASETTAGTVTLDELGAVTAEALDRQAIGATWKTIPLAESYQAKLMKIDGTAETVELGWQAADDALVLPDGWECDGEWDHTVWTASSVPYPRLDYTGCFVASPDNGRPITRFSCRCKCGRTTASVVDVTRLLIEAADSSGNWTDLAETAVSTKLTEHVLTFAAARDIRRIRLTCTSTSRKTMGDVAIGTVSLTYGEETLREVDSLAVKAGSVEFRDLDPAGRYRVVVVPQPSEGATSASATIDLANEKFRTTGALPLSRLHGDLYAESFDGLSEIDGDVEMRKAGLDHWQLFLGSGEAEEMLYTTGASRTTAGVYALGDLPGAPALGTMAKSTSGCSVGLAFRNDLATAVEVTELAFRTFQRTLKGKAATYVFEWLVTEGDAGIDAEGDWQPVAIPETAPCLESFADGDEHHPVEVALTERAGLPWIRIPRGGVLILRWRHGMVTGGPMMALDDVRVGFSRPKVGLRLLMR